MKQLLEAFIPLFVAMDTVGVLPIFMSYTQGMSSERRNNLVNQAIITVLVIAVLFLATGTLVFRFMGITENDFRIGGGVVLLVIAVNDLVFSGSGAEERAPEDRGFGVVPIGIPLIMGPAALTTILISVETHGYWITGTSLLLNMILVWVSFRYAHLILKFIGSGGAKAFAKVASLFIAAIAVMLIRVGVAGYFSR